MSIENIENIEIPKVENIINSMICLEGEKLHGSEASSSPYKIEIGSVYGFETKKGANGNDTLTFNVPINMNVENKGDIQWKGGIIINCKIDLNNFSFTAYSIKTVENSIDNLYDFIGDNEIDDALMMIRNKLPKK